MNIIDSSFWLEYFAETVEDTNSLIIPAITLYEVFKKLLLETTEDDALFCIAHMKQGNIINLNDELSLCATKLSIEFKLPMADSIIYATNLKYNGVLWTQDRHFSGLNFFNYFKKI
jgi:predicted nucleic acid-binding protein